MISLVLQFTLFFLVLFVLVPGVVVALQVLRNDSHYQKDTGWQKLIQHLTG